MAKLSKGGTHLQKNLLILGTYACALSPRKNCVLVIPGAIDKFATRYLRCRNPGRVSSMKEKPMTTFKELYEAEIAVIKARIIRGDRYSDIASDYRINQGRLSDLKHGKIFGDIEPAKLEKYIERKGR